MSRVLPRNQRAIKSFTGCSPGIYMAVNCTPNTTYNIAGTFALQSLWRGAFSLAYYLQLPVA